MYEKMKWSVLVVMTSVTLICARNGESIHRCQDLVSHKSGRDDDPFEVVYLLKAGTRRVANVRIKLLSKEEAAFETTAVAGDLGLDVRLTDVKTIRLFEAGLTTSLGAALPHRDDLFQYGTSNFNVGNIDVELDDGSSFTICVLQSGLNIGSSDYQEARSLYSWIIARIVDDVLFRKNGMHLTKDQFDAISGEGFVDSSRKLYDRIIFEK